MSCPIEPCSSWVLGRLSLGEDTNTLPRMSPSYANVFVNRERAPKAPLSSEAQLRGARSSRYAVVNYFLMMARNMTMADRSRMIFTQVHPTLGSSISSTMYRLPIYPPLAMRCMSFSTWLMTFLACLRSLA